MIHISVGDGDMADVLHAAAERAGELAERLSGQEETPMSVFDATGYVTAISTPDLCDTPSGSTDCSP